MTACTGYAALSETAPLAPYEFQRREPGTQDVEIEILFCGVCHSDLHQARGEWDGTIYPCIPGHEIVGRVTRIGSAVTRHQVGDLAAVGCLVDSCRTCDSCEEGLEQYCETGFTGTYNGIEKQTGMHTFGGYSSSIVVDEHFVLHVSEKLDPARVAPLLCAGITTYSPLRHWKVGPGKRVAIVGLGGLGHMGVKLAHAMGAHVTLLTTSPGKGADALRLGADEVAISTSREDMARLRRSFDFILDTVAARHDVEALLELVKRDGSLVQVGAPPEAYALNAMSFLFHRLSLSGSLIGGIAETQEMLDFCAEHDIMADIELIPIQKIEEAFARMVKSDVKYRFVIDMATLDQSRR